MLTLLFVGIAFGQMCTPASFMDPTTGTVYTYSNYHKVAATSAAQFITGSEPGQSWQAKINLCGNAESVGCTTPTPACQEDGAGRYVSMGSSDTWTARPYYDPTKGGDSEKLYGSGLFISISGGDLCSAIGQGRSSRFFLKCNPSITTLPKTVAVSERDPSDPSVPTTCEYWAAPIEHRDFCPDGTVGQGPQHNAPINEMTFTLPSANNTRRGEGVAVTAFGTSPVALLNAGLLCQKTNSSCADTAYLCQGTPKATFTANVTSLTVSMEGASWMYSTVDGAAAPKCPDTSYGYFSTTGAATWSEDDNGVTTADLNGASIFTVSAPSGQSCYSCYKK